VYPWRRIALVGRLPAVKEALPIPAPAAAAPPRQGIIGPPRWAQAHDRGQSFDGLAADNPPPDWVEAGPVGIVHVDGPSMASENGLLELPN